MKLTESRLRSIVREELSRLNEKKLITEGARFEMVVWPHSSESELKDKWYEDKMKWARTPQGPYDKSFGNFPIKITDKLFQNYKKAVNWLRKNAGRKSDYAKAVEVQHLHPEEGLNSHLVKQKQYPNDELGKTFWLIGKKIRE